VLLLQNGQPPKDEQIPILIGRPAEDVMPAIVELEEAGVFSRDDNGAIYCRKMLRQVRISETRSKAARARYDTANCTANASANASAKPPANVGSGSGSLEEGIQGEETNDLSVPPEALELADALAESIRSHQPKNKSISPAKWGGTRCRWARAFRLAHQRDDRTWAELRAVVDWLPEDDFWRTNILSAEKLREKFDQLDAKRTRKPTQPVSAPRPRRSFTEVY